MNLNRRRFVAGMAATPIAASLGALGGCSGGSGPQYSVQAPRVALAWIKNVEYAGLFVADELDYYTTEGMKPTFLAGGPNAPMPSVSVSAGNAQFGFDNDFRRFMDAVLLGNDLVIVGAQYQRSPGGVISLADRPVKKPADLLGCRFLGQEGVETIVDAVLTMAGLPVEYDYFPAGYSVAGLVEGQGNAYSGFAVNQVITLQTEYGMQEGKDFFFTSWSDLGLPGYANMMFCKREFVAAEFDTVVGFLRGTIKGWMYNAANPTFAPRLVVDGPGRDLGLDIEQQQIQNQIQLEYMHSPLTAQKGIFWVDPNDVETNMYPSLRATGRTGLPPATEVFDTRALQAAYAEIDRAAKA
ncbi:MAG: ABC transporter substrate-binding protein [Proteobacteria bacterium]|nr:ABC transporter substrate-binding protein [Pseudomonadota bacterium]